MSFSSTCTPPATSALCFLMRTGTSFTPSHDEFRVVRSRVKLIGTDTSNDSVTSTHSSSSPYTNNQLHLAFSSISSDSTNSSDVCKQSHPCLERRRRGVHIVTEATLLRPDIVSHESTSHESRTFFVFTASAHFVVVGFFRPSSLSRTEHLQRVDHVFHSFLHRR